jgi:hypothetical protein
MLNIYTLIPVIIVASGIVLGTHYLLFRILMRFFNFSKPIFRKIFFISLILLSVSFFIASAIIHFNDSLVARIFYLFSAVWLGLFTNLFLACCLTLFLEGIIKLFKAKVDFPRLGFIILLLAIVFSVYGAWNAFHPIVKNIEVKIKNLPEQWLEKNIVQISDLHLGYIHGIDFLEGVVEQVNALKPDLILITGDLFDGMDGVLESLVPSLKKFESTQGIFFVIGNHETYLGLEGSLSVLKKAEIKVLRNEMVDIDGLQIVGLDDLALNINPKLLEEILEFKKNQPNILMYHTPVNVDIIKKSGVDLQLSGHTHLGQLFPFSIITHIAHKGYDYGLFTEGDFSLYTTSGVGTWGPPMRTGHHPEIVNIILK